MAAPSRRVRSSAAKAARELRSDAGAGTSRSAAAALQEPTLRYPLSVDSRALVYLAAIADHGSIGRAARALCLTQPSLSKSVRRLERALKLRLLERTARGVIFTREGERVLQYARALVATLSRAERDVGAMRGLGAARVYLGMGRSVPRHLLASALASLAAGTQLIVLDGSTERLIQRVQLGELDLALVTAEPAELPPTLQATLLVRDPGVIAARRSHPLSGEQPLDAARLVAAEWIVPPRTHPLWQFLESLSERARRPLRVRAQTSSLSVAVELVACTDALTVLPQSLIGRPGGGELTVLPASDIRWSLPVALVARRGEALSLGARRVMERLLELRAAE